MTNKLESKSNVGKLMLYCPIETKAREMEAKVLLACVAAERGHKVIVGELTEVRRNVEFFPRGVYLSKSIPQKMEHYFKRYKNLGYAVAAWCEEGLVFLDREVYKRKMVFEGSLYYTDLFFAWGSNQSKALTEKVPESKDKIRNVGNPRMDVLREPYRGIYQNEAERLRSHYGPFILFNTNFALVNNIIGKEHAFEDSKKRGKTATKGDEEHYWEFFSHRHEIFEGMKGLVKTVSRANPDKQIIVRPHPSENHDTWRKLTSDLDNVKVAFEGSVVPWLMAAEVMIHNGCTTAVEAYLLETPAIAFRPVIRENYEFELPNDVSIQGRNQGEVLKAIELAINKGAEYERWRADAARHLEMYMADFRGSFASDRILDELEAYYTASPIAGEWRVYPFLRFVKHRVGQFVRNLKQGTGLKGAFGTPPYSKSRHQKLPDLSIEEVEDLVSRLQLVSGRFEGVTVSALAGCQRSFLIQCR